MKVARPELPELLRCAKCGVEQDPDKPTCIHLIAAKGGRAAQRAIRAKYGPGTVQSKGGRRSALIRWGHRRSKESSR